MIHLHPGARLADRKEILVDLLSGAKSVSRRIRLPRALTMSQSDNLLLGSPPTCRRHEQPAPDFSPESHASGFEAEGPDMILGLSGPAMFPSNSIYQAVFPR